MITKVRAQVATLLYFIGATYAPILFLQAREQDNNIILQLVILFGGALFLWNGVDRVLDNRSPSRRGTTPSPPPH